LVDYLTGDLAPNKFRLHSLSLKKKLTKNQMEEIETKSVNTRPVFLTVLCVMTFIGSGLNLYNGVSEYFKAPTDSLSTARSIVPEYGNYFDAAEKRITNESETRSIYKIIGAALCLFGAWRMWELKKNGLFIYSTGIVAEFFGIIYKLPFNDKFLVQWAIADIMFVFIMLGLYLANYKHLRS
jgi:hypothetical protein